MSEEYNWSNDDWETPDDIAKKMAGLMKPSDRIILEPCAGTGQIFKYLGRQRLAMEIKPEIDCVEEHWSRYEKGRKQYGIGLWSNSNFFEWKTIYKYDLIITNPPFSKLMQFIERSLGLLEPTNPEARLLFLMPIHWASSKERAEHWRSLNARIHHIHLIEGRVDYLQNGVPASKLPKLGKNGSPIVNPMTNKPILKSGRQCNDAVFDIRLGKGGCVSYL